MTRIEFHTRSVATLLGVALLAVLGSLLVLRSDVRATLESQGSSAAAAGSSPDAGLDALEVTGPGSRVAPTTVPRLFILDGESRELIAPTRLSVSPTDGPAVELTGRGPWELPLAACGLCDVVVEAAGMVAVAGGFTLAPGENRILLTRAGELRITLRDDRGAPVEGVELCLVAPRPDVALEGTAVEALLHGSARPRLRATDAGWTLEAASFGFGGGSPRSVERIGLDRVVKRTTDASGTARWIQVPPGPGYRWTAETPHLVEPSPPHERARLEMVDDSLRVSSSSAPPGVSGAFEILAGRRVELSGAVQHGAVVRGRVTTAAARARVVLYRVEESTSAGARRGVSFDARHAQWTATDGAFEFRDVHPGAWMLRAWWAEREEDLHFAARAFRVASGSQLDLGTISALEGDSLEFTIVLRDALGRPLAPSDVFPSPAGTPYAELSLNVVPSDEDANHMLSGMIPVPFDRSFRVHGFRPGRVLVAARPGPKLVPDVARVSRVDGAHAEPFEVGTRDAVTLSIVAHMGTSRPLVLRTPEGERMSAHSVWVHELATNATWLAETRLEAAEGGEQSVLTLPDGTYDLWCKLTIQAEASRGYAGNARVTFDSASTGPVELPLALAATVSGVVRDREGRPVAKRALAWSAGGWPVGEGTLTMYAATTDEEGRFVLAEIPPGVKLWGVEPGTDLAALERGAQEVVQLVIQP